MKDTNNDLKQEIRDIQKKHEDDTCHLQAELKHYKEKYDDVKRYKEKFEKVKEHLHNAQQQAKFEQYIKPQCIVS
jgi:hypothetical protein